ncbi:MAG: TonB-dependent receptor, partial [Moraxella sp.]|nr:TonB-dependent receptor [Moraxella sp.]
MMASSTKWASKVRSGNVFKEDGIGGSVRYQASFGDDKTDALVGIKYSQDGMYYQADGRMVGIYGNQGDVQGSKSHDVFAKVAHHLDDDKKMSVAVNHYHLEGSQKYMNVAGNRAIGLTDTAVKHDGKTPQGKNPYNDVLTVNTTFNDEDFFGTSLAAQAFYNKSSARYGANFAANYQDPKLAKNGELLDQSQNDSTKIGAKLTLNKNDLLSDRLSLTGGVDLMQDKTGQDLITHNRTWAPVMTYQNVAPFVQGRLDVGRLSLSGGLRYEYGKLSVDDFSTLAGYTRNKSFGARQWTYTPVKGGELEFDELLPSVGLVYDFGQVQAFASHARGYGMPDVGRTLREITTPDQGVQSLDLKPVVTDNTEVGVRFVGDKASFDVSAFQSKSKLGQAMIPREDGDGYYIQREKTDIKGVEANARYQATKRTELTLGYAHIQGKFEEDGKGVMVDMPARNISPDKLALGVNYKFDDGKRFNLTATHLFGRDYRRTDKVSDKFDGYTLVDLAYRQPWGGGEFSLGVNNLLNHHYDVFLTDVVLPTSDRYTGGQGRNYVVGY